MRPKHLKAAFAVFITPLIAASFGAFSVKWICWLSGSAYESAPGATAGGILGVIGLIVGGVIAGNILETER
jgi:hypothetical protein